MSQPPLPKIMFVGAHQDDMQGAAAGLFAKLRKHLDYEGLEVTLTNGAGGHQSAKYLKYPDELIQRRLLEAQTGAKKLGFSYQLLQNTQGQTFPDGDLQITRETKAAVWQAVRQFQPQLLVTLPVNHIHDSFGMHNDHTNTGEIVKRIAYLIAAPLAFPETYDSSYVRSLNGTEELPYVQPPFIATTHDGYSGQIEPDLIIDITDEISTKAEAFYQHVSQVDEWLPWVGRYPKPNNVNELQERLARRSAKIAADFGLKDGVYEAYTLTAWGSIPSLEDVKTFFPGDALGYEMAAKKLALFQR